MTLTDLYQLLNQTGYPVAYSQFTDTEENPAPDPPFITYLEVFSDNFIADNKVQTKIRQVQVELNTDIKDLQAELNLESLLDENDIPYQTTETYIESERLYQRIYEIGVV